MLETELEGLTVVDDEWLDEYSENPTVNLNTYTWIISRCPTPPDNFDVQFEMYKRGDYNAMVESIMALAINCAKKRFSLPIPREDIVQMAFEGACQAVKEWDPSRGVSLYAFAQTVIMRFISKECREDIEPMRIPDSQARVIVAVRNAYKILAFHKKAPTVDEVYETAKAAWKNTSNKLTKESVIVAIDYLSRSWTAVDQPHGEHQDMTIGDILECPSNDLAFYEEIADTSIALSYFTAKQREVHDMHASGMSFPAIGEELGVSHQAARCRWDNGLARAKKALYCGE